MDDVAAHGDRLPGTHSGYRGGQESEVSAEPLGEAQIAILEAITCRLIPSDEPGPGAREAKVTRYIGRALVEEYRELKPVYEEGLALLDRHAREMCGEPFAELSGEVQDGLLRRLEAGDIPGFVRGSAVFFELLLRHSMEGMFGDPRWGGNADRAGWELLGYPGPRFVWTAADQALDADVAKKHEGAEPRSVTARSPRSDRPSEGKPRPADVVIIGLGASGGIAAHVLTDAGLEVVALEAGSRVDSSIMTLDEIRNDIHSWLSEPKAMYEIPTWRETSSMDAGPSPWPMLMVNAVGGSSVHYPALSVRLAPWNFKSKSQVEARYGQSAIPEGSTLADWPIDYDELEPYYDIVERTIGVSGKAGNLRGEQDPRGNPFEGRREREYDMAPLRRTGWTELMANAAVGLGWHPYAAPAAINTEPFDGNLECTYCGFCAYNGCYRNAKGSTSNNVIPRAEATGLLRVETGARVLQIESDADGLVTGVTYLKDDRRHFQPAKVVLLGTFTYENTRLLLLSRSKAHPNGLSNNHGQVGQHFMTHVTPFLFGTFGGRRLNIFSGNASQSTCLDDWNADNFDHSNLGFISGGMITAGHEAKPVASALSPLPQRLSRWGNDWKRWIHEHGQSIGSVYAQMEGLPYEGNHLDLDPHVKDGLGAPVIRVTHQVRDNERRGCAFLGEKLESWLREAGARETWSSPAFRVLVEGRHSYGGTRMGDDPATSVVDRNGFSHEAPNLGVLGTSTFPTTGGQNPTLTLQALAWRTAQHLVDHWLTIARDP